MFRVGPLDWEKEISLCSARVGSDSSPPDRYPSIGIPRNKMQIPRATILFVSSFNMNIAVIAEIITIPYA